jgi:hypothetical protein
VSQGNEEAHEAFHGISPKPTSQHGRHLGLIDTHEPGRGCLGQMPLPDGPVDLDHQASLDQVFAGVGQTEVRESSCRRELCLYWHSQAAKAAFEESWFTASRALTSSAVVVTVF